MATRKKFKQPTYFAYYDVDTGAVLGITNGPLPDQTYIPVPYELACKFLSATDNYNTYTVGIVKKKGKQVQELVKRQLKFYSTKHQSFDRIYEAADRQDIIVEWNYPNKAWSVSLNTDAPDGISKFFFYVALENDFNQIVATLVVDVLELTKNGEVSIPFTTELEHNISKIEVLSRLLLPSYGLKITHE